MEAVFPYASKYEWASKVKLGSGSYGVVYKVKKLNSDQYVAIKEMDMSNFKDEVMIKALETEIDIMRNLKDEHIVRLEDSLIGPKVTYIILELCDGDLRKKMEKSGGKLPEEEAVQAFSQIVKGFKTLTNLGYIHRDIKPQNTLIKGNIYKVADFGFSCKADIGCIKRLDFICGTPLYMCPQLLNQQVYTAKCDIWSLGVMLYEIIFGYSPWVCRNLQSYKQNIMTRPLAFPYNGKIGEHTKDFIRKCLVIDEKYRLSWKELFEHPLVQDKNTGTLVAPLDVHESVVKIMKRIQESAARKHINVKEILVTNKIEKMDEKKFFEICQMIDLTISNFEVTVLFELLDKSKDKFVSFDEFKVLLLENDFRDVDDVAGRYIRELMEVARQRKFDLDKMFKTYDKNSSGIIQRYEFTNMLRELLPKMSEDAIQKVWLRFDKDKNNKIELKEFIYEMTYGCANPNSPAEVNRERTTRCLTALKAAIQYYKVNLQSLMDRFDKNNDAKLDFKEFSNLVTAIDKKLPEEELKLMFDYLDVDKSGTASVAELRPILY